MICLDNISPIKVNKDHENEPISDEEYDTFDTNQPIFDNIGKLNYNTQNQSQGISNVS